MVKDKEGPDFTANDPRVIEILAHVASLPDVFAIPFKDGTGYGACFSESHTPLEIAKHTNIKVIHLNTGDIVRQEGGEHD